MDQADIPALLSRLASDEDAARKMAVFKLQSSINDPAFADVFISSGGLVVLRRLIMSTGGNTLAYSLQSLTRLLEVDMGWDIFEGPAAGDLVERVVELIVTNPLVNILRGAMSILVALVSHSQSDAGARNPATTGARLPGSFGFRALKPAVAVYPHFFELVIAQLHAPDRPAVNGIASNRDDQADTVAAMTTRKGSRRHNPEKWRRLGFETESPAQEFDVTGFLGMMDLTDYVRKHEDGFQKILLEQSTRPLHERCPIARASLAVTMILYDHFDVDRAEAEEHKSYQGLDVSAKNNDKLFRPLLLQWSRLHTAGLLAFFRLWKATGAAQADFDKVTELVRILVEQVVGRAARTRDVLEVEDDLAEHDCARLRELQMELLELSFEDAWGQHLYQVREELKQEALQFVKEQRVRCLLQGAWFSKPLPRRDTNATDSGDEPPRRRLYTPMPWRFAKLSHNRRFLHYADFVTRTPQEPGLDTLTEKVDLGTISSVVSNVSAPDDAASAATVKNLHVNGHSHTHVNGHSHTHVNGHSHTHVNGHGDATPTPTTAAAGLTGSSTKITIFRFADPSDPSAGESAVLALHPVNHSAASEWLDGLLMLLNQAPITAETNKLVGLVSEYGLKIRLLNVRVEAAYAGPPPGAGVVPSRAGLDEDYYYEV
ncbi:hypothetical protein BN1723_002513 [Verticillium longisporum]|uniref:ELMO domain-containing protein n=1 Tax=Verticillium longisporum TaxID=100787 RepID=A0A0G4L8U6_VERLO|nr:hypothetical protein BN1723_002513 [Verticillium longisporum]